MNTKTLAFISAMVLGLGVSPSSQGQKPAIYSFDITDSVTGYSSFNDVKVIDQRANKKSFGHLRKSEGFPGLVTIESRPALTTSKPLAEALRDFGRASIAKAVKGEDTLLMVLQNFYMYVDPASSETAIFYFRAILFLGKSAKFKLLGDVDTFIALKGYEIVNQVVIASSKIVFDQFKLAAGAKSQVIAGHTYTTQEAADLLRKMKKDTKIYNTQTYLPGVYNTVGDFLNQTPSVEVFIQKDNYIDDKNRPYFYYKDIKGKKGERITSAFAIYNGERWFKRHKGIWTQFTFRDGDFYLGRHLRFNLIRRKFMPAVYAETY